MYTIYQITNRVNGKSYVGFTIESQEVRWTKHQCSANRGSNTYFHKAIRKHGAENFNIITLKTGEDHEWGLKVEEPYHISLYRTNDPTWGYNLTEGGDGVLGYKHTEEFKQWQSERVTGTKQSEEWSKRQSKRMMGRTLSEETRNKISESLKGNQNCKGKRNALGYKQTEEFCKKQSERLKGIPHSEEWASKISDSLKGNQNCKGKKNALGYKHTEEQRKAKSERQRGIKYKIVTCPHCNRHGGVAPMKRWHFDNCKQKGVC